MTRRTARVLARFAPSKSGRLSAGLALIRQSTNPQPRNQLEAVGAPVREGSAFAPTPFPGRGAATSTASS